MHCNSCGFVNGEEDHRCLRCGRRLSGVVIAAPPDYKPADYPAARFTGGGFAGANALAMASSYDPEMEAPNAGPEASPVDDIGQTALFEGAPVKPVSNLIIFDRRPRGTPNQNLPQVAPSSSQARRPVAKKPVKQAVEQARLEFPPSLPVRARKLKDDVDAQVFCDRPVATATHRCMATGLDATFIMIGFGLMLLIVQSLGGSFGEGRNFYLALGATFTIVCFFYGLMWVMAGRESAGMNWVKLELVTFDGLPVDGTTRVLRFATAWLSFCSGTLGLVWALADEERLTWHDHISKTFPAVRETTRPFVRT